MSTPAAILDLAFDQVVGDLTQPVIDDAVISRNIEFVSRHPQNRACVRLLLACCLAKSHKSNLDIRKPYTEISGSDCYSGRRYDEVYITSFINQHELPCNPTTAFLTPALRNRNIILTPEVNLVGKPPILYKTVLQLLDNVYQGQVLAEDMLAETIRYLLIIRDENRQRLTSLIANLRTLKGAIPLSTEAIVKLIEQHLNCPNSSRLPVLIVAAAYTAASSYLGQIALPLTTHNAADEQTGALGDIEITLFNDDNVITSYEMKMKKVTVDDLNRAIQKIRASSQKIDNYIFITTEQIDQSVQDYASGIYERTGGIEFVVLDCISFLRHFLHLFHRLRMNFLETYQQLVIDEPASAVNQSLKEAFLALRQAAESNKEDLEE
ncbi:restriction endonuclease, SacI family [Calothrix sp. FACHB-1219]|uniref:restriction endonuclease, SacI family n=1 Tax=unclassified Calothrix TaxID=2619626 RepID=UPI00168408DA|nr:MULTISPECIES: restriction endonuclease, SacI family [unclassified Calothrix]MBD2206287.1 restriction endonuclease, SacI family [Calothrix sp. FACHB-168]MBD2219183.1 restriction endonuclease, SacI family [Calothrix sp. FACHB-1219]